MTMFKKKRETDTLTKTLVEKFMFLYINARTKIQLDEAGQRVRDSAIKTRTDGIIQQNEAKIQKLNTQRAGELERIEYQEKKKILFLPSFFSICNKIHTEEYKYILKNTISQNIWRF